VQVHETRDATGRAAAEAVSAHLREALAAGGEARVVFACAPSQVEFLAALTSAPDIDWNRVTAFHMDEYVGMAPDAPRSFARFIREYLIDKVSVGRVHYINGAAANAAAECDRYATLLGDAPIDLVCMGIGENGHIAFNDPPVADFSDPLVVKVVELDERCRLQQVNEGAFPTLAAVPTHALTLTVPTLMSGRVISCVVPAASKAEAVLATLTGPIATSCPASILRTHPRATLFLDRESASLLPAAAQGA
jgi:glucosamine-6-phosphate deaminase